MMNPAMIQFRTSLFLPRNAIQRPFSLFQHQKVCDPTVLKTGIHVLEFMQSVNLNPRRVRHRTIYFPNHFLRLQTTNHAVLNTRRTALWESLE
jgi:hypothetical protein